jgi:ubiquinone/menaquinone biosynthesis C-methylase UbiE
MDSSTTSLPPPTKKVKQDSNEIAVEIDDKLILNPTNRFSSVAQLYRQYRPTYPLELLEWIKQQIKPTSSTVVVDVGAGTGIFTRLLLDLNYAQTLAIEPNEAMRIESNLPDTIMKAGSAENTNLPSESVDAIFVAQAFHWFNIEKTLIEFKRISKNPETTLNVVFWNDRVLEAKSGELAEFTTELDQLYHRHATEEYGKMPRPLGTTEKLAKRIPNGQHVEFQHVDYLSLETLLGRAWSTSYINNGVKDKKAFDDDMTNLFKKYATQNSSKEDGLRVPLVYVCRCFYWLTKDVVF